MNTKHLLVLVVAAVLLIGLASWSSRSRRTSAPSEIGKPLLADLDVNAIRRIELRQGDRTVVLAYADNAWGVTNLFGYPADFSKLRQNLLALKDLKIADVASDMTLAGKDTAWLDLQNAQGRSLAALTLGPKRQKPSPGGEAWSTPDGRYLSRAGDTRVLLVKETLDAFDGNAQGWVNTELFNVPSSDIATIEIVSPEGARVQLDRTSGTLQLAGLTDDEEFDSSKRYGVESALGYLRFTEIANPALTPAETGLDKPHRFHAELKNGQRYTAEIGKSTDGGDRYARFSVALGASATTNLAERAELERQVTERNGHLAPWAFLISSYTAGNLCHARADLVKPKVPPAAENSEPADKAADGATDDAKE